MCDFAIAARQEEQAVIVVVEIKNTAREHAIKQLQAGLDVIYEYLSPKSRERVSLEAYVIANKGIPHFMKLLRAKGSEWNLNFGYLTVPPRVKKCETTLSV